jgi:UDP-glucose 4-epimerase
MAKSKILLIGANGYIGCRVLKELRRTGADVTGIDNYLRADRQQELDPDIVQVSYQNLKPNFLDTFTDCVWLAGHSSVGMSVADEHGALRNNLYDLIDFSNSFRGRLIYASSGSVYSRPIAEASIESSTLMAPSNIYDYTKVAFDNYLSATNKQAVGLRFGTVNGWAERLRKELMLNSMVLSCKENGYLWASNTKAFRPILFIEDLVRAIVAILNSQVAQGIYNLASFNMSIGQIAAEIADELGAEIKYKPDSPTYNFMMDTSSFEKTFDFEFSGTPTAILKSFP